MIRLNGVPGAVSRKSWLDRVALRVRILCAIVFAVAVSAMEGPYALLCASALPLALLFCGPVKPLLKIMLRINVIGLVTAALLIVTYPGLEEGVRKGAVLLARLNIISVTVLRLIVSMGPGRVDAALSSLGLPEKFRIILLLTQRGIFILSDRMNAALCALRLRAPRMKLNMKLRAFSGVAASSLLQGADRAERMALAIMCRGGMKGFDQ